MPETPSALKHDEFYPKLENTHILFAYGFRIFFYFLPLYVITASSVWPLVFSGTISWPTLNDIVFWHLYEFIFGFGLTAIFGFILTAIPEMFPGTKTIIGNKLKLFFGIWISGRAISLLFPSLLIGLVWIIDSLIVILILAWITPPILKDKKFKQFGIWFSFLLLTILHQLSFLSYFELIKLDVRMVLNTAFYIFIILIVLVLRRVVTELTNVNLYKSKINESFVAKPFRYNILALALLSYAALNFYGVNDSILFWISLSITSSALGVLHDFSTLKYNLWNFSTTRIFSAIFIMTALSFMLKAYAHYTQNINMVDLNHLITIGTFLSTIFLTMTIVSHIHTGRFISNETTYECAFYLLLFAAILRSSPALINHVNVIFWLWIPSVIVVSVYILLFFKIKTLLTSRRVDNMPG